MTDTEFQLNPDDFKTGNWLVDGQIKKLIKALNEADFNKDGKQDLGQIAGVVVQLLPLWAMLNQAIDFELLADALAESPWVRDKAMFKEALKKLGALAEQSQPLLPGHAKAPGK